MKPFVCKRHGLIEDPYVAPKLRNGRPHRHCPLCREATLSKWNKVNGSAAHKRWYDKHREREQTRQKERRRQEKLEIIQAYGGACQCCGDDHYEFLSVDHVNRDGAAKRKSGEHAGASFYRNLKKLGFPKDEFRLLCMNCNFARGRYGRCPHETEAAETKAS